MTDPNRLADPFRELAHLIVQARALHLRADALWTAHPIAALESVRVLRNELEYRIADLEADRAR